jgi:hypothetical protein
MTEIQITALRNRTWHYLSYEVAIFAGMTGVNQLQQFVAGTYHPTEEQLIRLANRTGGIPR